MIVFPSGIELNTRLMILDMKTRPLFIMLISWGILVLMNVKLLMVLRMV